MAQIILPGDELVCILNANGLVPQEVMNIEVLSEEIQVRVRTPLPVLKSIRVGIRLVDFERGRAVLQLVTNRLIDRFDWLVDRMLAKVPLADHGARWEYPRLHLDVNELLRRQVRGVRVTGMALKDGQFHITTRHAPDADSSRGQETEHEKDGTSTGFHPA